MGAVRKALAVEEIAGAAFLGVTASARGLAWRDRLDAAAAMTAIAICQRHGLPEPVGSSRLGASALTRSPSRSTPASRR